MTGGRVTWQVRFPSLYPPNKECIWTITVRRPFGPSSLLKCLRPGSRQPKSQTAKGIPPAKSHHFSPGKSQPPPLWSVPTIPRGK